MGNNYYGNKMKVNIKGKVFGCLTVITVAPYIGKSSLQVVKCDCSDKTIKIVRTHSLLKGDTLSCGCFRRKIGTENLANWRRKTKLKNDINNEM